MKEQFLGDALMGNDIKFKNSKDNTNEDTLISTHLDQNKNRNELSKSSAIISTATRKLALVCCVCSTFMLIEFVGGLMSNSIAIMTDAAHLLSDLAGFLISIYALHVSSRTANANYTFGYHRAEIVGAVASIFIIWILTALLLVESITRLLNPHEVVQGGIMLITSTIGLVFNGVMAYVLHSGEGECHHNHHHENEQTHSLLKKSSHNSNNTCCKSNHDHNHKHHHDHDHDHDHKHKHNHALDSLYNNESSLRLNYRENYVENPSSQNIIIEDSCEDHISTHGNSKSQNSVGQIHIIEMKDIDSTEINYIGNQSYMIPLTEKTEQMFKKKENGKKDSLIINRSIQNDFEIIDNTKFTKRKSANISNKVGSTQEFGSPHVSKKLTRGHSKLHHLDAFIGLKELDEDTNSSHNSESCHSGSFHTIPINITPKDNDQKQLASPNKSHSHHHHDHNESNINVQAAFIHIIGDIIQSIGVIISACLIYFFPSYQFIDPLTTILFSIIVITTTVPIIKQCVYAIMEGNTSAEDFVMIKNELLNAPGVISVSCLHLYYLSLDKAVLCAHVKVIKSTNENELLRRIYEELNKYKLYHCTIEISKDDSSTCSNMMEIL